MVDLECGESFLVLMLDMLNYFYGVVNVKWDVSDDGEVVVFRALKTIDEGEELLT